jgi:PrtD family type I secretion system ABC transporter
MAGKLSPVLASGIAGFERYLASAAAFSFFINLLTLCIPLYSIQLYDRVLSGGSGATLFVLSVAAAAGLLAAAALEDIRGRLLIALGIHFDARLSARLFERLADLRRGSGAPGGHLIRDLDNVRHALTGGGAVALFDLPWSVIFIAACFYLHPLLGTITLAGTLVVIALALANQGLVAHTLARSNELAEASYRLTDSVTRNIETVRAMGMLPALLARWSALRSSSLDNQATASMRNSTLASAMKLSRYSLLLATMGAGAWLAVVRELSPGALFAASLLCTRALIPVDQMVGIWRQLGAAWAALQRVEAACAGASASGAMKLPAPTGHLRVEELSYTPQGARVPALNNVSFEVNPGDAVGIVGPSAAGKSTLARLIVGVDRPTHGSVRLDAAETWSWDRADFGAVVGYLSQNIELFEGKISENIARFRPTDGHDIVAAARLAGVHEMILALPEGYDTVLDATGSPLSGGQRQRIALARAVFGNPRLVVLDEPNSSLDGAGEAGLLTLLSALKARGTTVLMIAHRPSMLVALDKVLVLADGTVSDYGLVEKVMPRIAPGYPLAQKRLAGRA